jgi:hypothetical protein
VSGYRLYRLDWAGKIVSADWIEALDDTEAAHQACDGSPVGTCEVWQRNRLVVRIEDGKVAPTPGPAA